MSNHLNEARIPWWVTAADVLACALLALAAVALVTGTGPILRVGSFTIQATSELRLSIWAALVVAIRHLAFPRENLWRRLARLPQSLTWQRLTSGPPLGRDGFLDRDAAGRITLLEMTFVAALMVVLTALMTYPQIRRLGEVRNVGDPLFSIWRLAWIAHQLRTDPLHLFDGNIYYPARLTLAYSDSIVLPGIAAAPFFWLGVPAAQIYNVIVLATFVLAGVTMYALVRVLTRQRPAAFLAAVVFAFYPFRFEHYDCLELLFAFWMPLALLAFHLTLARGRLRDGLMVGGAMAAQMLSCVYFGLFLAVYLVPFGGALALGLGRVRTAVKPLLAGVLFASALTIPMVVPHLQARQLIGERAPTEIEAFSLTPQDYLSADQTRPAWAKLLGSRPGGPERSFPGVAVVVLALVALWPPLSAPRIAYTLGLLVAFEASLGSHGYVFPFLYREFAPFRGLRCPGRFSMMVGLSLAVLAGYGVARVNAHLRRPFFGYFLAAALSAVVLFESRSVLPLDPVPRPHPVYQWFHGRPPSVVAELPTKGIEPQWQLEARYTYLSIFHWQKIVNGYSGVIPGSYAKFRDSMATFPDDESMRILRAHGTNYVILHEESYGRAKYQQVVDAVERRDDLQQVVASNGPYEARIYRILR